MRAFDNKYYTKAAITEKPLVETAYDLEEFELVRPHTDRVVKGTFTGACIIVGLSYDEHYARDGILLGAPDKERVEARRRF